MKTEPVNFGAGRRPGNREHPITTDGANGNAARELNERTAPSLRLADRDEASAVALCVLAKSAGHVSDEVTRKLVAVANGRATVPDEVVEVWRNIVDGPTTKLCRRVGRRKATMTTETQRPTLLAAAQGSATRHEMVSDDGPTWCKLCGTFDVYCFRADGTMTECHPKPESERWWNPKSPKS